MSDGVTFLTFKECQGDVRDGAQHCLFPSGKVVSQDDKSYTCYLPRDTFVGDAGAVALNKFMTAPVVLSGSQACGSLDLEKSLMPTPTRRDFADPAVYRGAFKIQCDRTIQNNGAAGACPSVKGPGDARVAVNACPAFLSTNSNTGTVCGQLRGDILGGVPTSHQLGDGLTKVVQSSTMHTDTSGTAVITNPADHRDVLDAAAVRFCTEQGDGDDGISPHPMCQCIRRETVPTYQLMQSTEGDNIPDACWWKPCQDPKSIVSMVTKDLEVGPDTCPPVVCNELIDISNLYAETISLTNLSFYTNCNATSLKKVYGEKCDPSGTTVPSAPAAATTTDASGSSCPVDVSGFQTCAASTTGVRCVTTPCDTHTGVSKWICVQWHASVLSAAALILIPIVVGALLIGLFWLAWGSSSSPPPTRKV